MYRPTAFDVIDVTELHDAIAASGPAHLLSSTGGGLTGSVVPLFLDHDRGPHGSLVGHLARANRHWRDATAGSESLAIFAGPDAYISPSWYATKQQTGKVVPTWNYEVIHALSSTTIPCGSRPTCVASPTITKRIATNAGQSTTPPPTTCTQLRAIAGIELPITRIEDKHKLSQNRPAADITGAIDGLSAGTATERAVATRMMRVAR